MGGGVLTRVGVVPRMIAGGAATVYLAELASIACFMNGAAEGAFGHWGACSGGLVGLVSGCGDAQRGSHGRCSRDRRTGPRRHRGRHCWPYRRRHRGRLGGLGQTFLRGESRRWGFFFGDWNVAGYMCAWCGVCQLRGERAAWIIDSSFDSDAVTGLGSLPSPWTRRSDNANE